MTDPLKKPPPPSPGRPQTPVPPALFGPGRPVLDVFAALSGGASHTAQSLRARMTFPGHPATAFGSGNPLQVAFKPLLTDVTQAVQRTGTLVDSRLDQVAHQGADKGFERLRGLKMDNLAWYQVQQKAINAGVDLVADHGPVVVRATSGIAREVRQRVVGNLVTRGDPRLVLAALASPPETAMYFRQKAQPLVQLAKVAENPREALVEFARQAPASARQSAMAALARIGELDKREGSVLGMKFQYPDPAHAGRAGLEWSEDIVATAIGVTIASKALFLSPKARANTREMSQRIVSDERLKGKLYRYPARFTVNGFARIANNKRLALAVGAYWAVTAAGDAVNKSRQLSSTDPKRYAQLKKDGKHLKGAANTISITEAIDKTRRKKDTPP